MRVEIWKILLLVKANFPTVILIQASLCIVGRQPKVYSFKYKSAMTASIHLTSQVLYNNMLPCNGV